MATSDYGYGEVGAIIRLPQGASVGHLPDGRIYTTMTLGQVSESGDSDWLLDEFHAAGIFLPDEVRV